MHMYICKRRVHFHIRIFYMYIVKVYFTYMYENLYTYTHTHTHTHTMGHYPDVRKEENLATCNNIDGHGSIMLSEVSQMKTDII